MRSNAIFAALNANQKQSEGVLAARTTTGLSPFLP